MIPRAAAITILAETVPPSPLLSSGMFVLVHPAFGPTRNGHPHFFRGDVLFFLIQLNRAFAFHSFQICFFDQTYSNFADGFGKPLGKMMWGSSHTMMGCVLADFSSKFSTVFNVWSPLLLLAAGGLLNFFIGLCYGFRRYRRSERPSRIREPVYWLEEL